MKTLALSSPHARGRDVSDAQSKLQAAGFLAEQPDGEFGTLTMQACRRAHYWLGFDGSLQYAPTYGDRLDALLDDFLDDGKLAAPYGARRAARVAAGKRASSSVGGRALAKAAGELGYKESPAGSNHQKFGVWYGVDRQPWCAMFVSWCFWRAGMGEIKYSYCNDAVTAFKDGRWSCLVPPHCGGTKPEG
jgi:hypothetical protein